MTQEEKRPPTVDELREMYTALEVTPEGWAFLYERTGKGWCACPMAVWAAFIMRQVNPDLPLSEIAPEVGDFTACASIIGVDERAIGAFSDTFDGWNGQWSGLDPLAEWYAAGRAARKALLEVD